MKLPYSTHYRCACTRPDGEPPGWTCPKLFRKDGSWNSRHGSTGYATRVPTSAGTRQVKRFGFTSTAEREASAEHTGKLLDLAPDGITRAKIGDMIVRIKRGAPLPAVEDVRRRLGLSQDPGVPGTTFGESWDAWLSGNKRLQASARRRLEGIGTNWLLPVLADVPLERLTGAHCTAVFDRIERINAEITAQRSEGRALVKAEGDVRQRPYVVGVASQHRVFAALRTVLNFEVKVTHRLAFNPVYSVRLEPEETPEAQRWSAAEAARFLAATADDQLGLMFRVAVLRGPRRGELVGFRWAAADLDAGYLGVGKTILQLGGVITPEDKAKTRTSKRRIWLDDATVKLLKEHRETQFWARLTAGDAWQENDLVFCRDDGTPWPPDLVSRRFKSAARAAGVPVIKMHEGGRHTARSLGDDAGIASEISQRMLGHASRAMSDHYNHPEAARFRQAAEDVARYVEGAGS